MLKLGAAKENLVACLGDAMKMRAFDHAQHHARDICLIDAQVVSLRFCIDTLDQVDAAGSQTTTYPGVFSGPG
jgi:hypothetical protein